MKPKLYQLLERCIEEGLDSGYTQAHKHTDEPDRLTILSKQRAAILLELNEWFEFEDVA